MKQPGALLVYVVTVQATALLGLSTLDWQSLSGRVTVTGLLVLMAALVGARPIRIPGVRTAVSATDPFVISAMAFCGGASAVATSVAGVLGSTAAPARRRPRLMLVSFNLASSSLAAMAAHRLLLLSGGGPGVPTLEQIFPLVAATAAYFVVNTALVAAAVSLERSVPFLSNWRSSARWTSLSAVTGLTVAVLLLLLLDAAGPTGLVLGLPPCWLLMTFYQSHKERIERQQEQMDQVLVYNERLEAEVRDRTIELRAAVAKLERTNREIQRANVRLNEANRAKNTFLANMSHELRTPLNAIIGFSELMAEGNAGPLNETQRAHCEDIRDSGVHLLHLIDGILDLAKIEAGRLDVHKEEVDVAMLVHEACAMLKTQATGSGVALVAACDPGTGVVRVDPGLFRQVLINLVSNAVKFTPDGGRVEVRADRRGDDLVVTVSDTGIGIDPRQQSRIFDEFYQADASYSRRYPGSGLGLALVRRMVRLHDGLVRLDSVPGEGSTFTVEVPGCFDGTAGERQDYENETVGDPRSTTADADTRKSL